MENKNNCSSKDHSKSKAISFCEKCEIYMCKKCEKVHSNLCPKHHIYQLDKECNEIFTGICEEKGHYIEYKYFCKTHNKLCCAYCITAVKDKEYGQHKNCQVCKIEEIKYEKQNKLKQNIENLEILSNAFHDWINEFKKIFNKINKDKEELKNNIQNIFTKIRNDLNKREDEILLEVDKQFEELYSNEDLIKESEKLPNKMKLCLEKGKKIEKNWDNNELKLIIHDCINMENNVKEIDNINESVKKCILNSNKTIRFSETNNLIDKIKTFGNLHYNTFKFKECPKYISKNRIYTVTGKNQNILTKTGNDYWMGTICDNDLQKLEIHKWKIKILKTQYKYIMIGVAPIDFDINKSDYSNCGWYIYCENSKLFSGPPFNYNNQDTTLSKIKDEIIVVMDMNKGSLKFIIDNEEKEESYTNIPLDKPIAPAICLYNLNDSVEIIDC